MDPREDEPLLFALAVELLREERVSKYHRLRSLFPIACPTSLYASPSGHPRASFTYALAGAPNDARDRLDGRSS